MTEERAARRHLAALVAAMDAIWRSDRLDRLAETLVEQSAELLPGTVTSFMLADPARPDDLVIVAASEPWLRGLELPIRTSVAGRAMAVGEPVEISLGDAVHVDRLGTEAITFLRGAPLPTSDPPAGLRASGALVFLSRRPAGFEPEERELMDQFARLAALAFDRARLLARARDSAAGTEKAFSVAMTLAAERAPREVMRTLLERAVEALGAERATLSSIDESGTLTIEATYSRHHDEPTWIGRSYSMDLVRSQPTVQEALSERRPVISGRLDIRASQPEFRAALERTAHTLTLPLVHAGAAEALLVLSREEDRPFNEADLVTAQLIGTAAMLALSNARLYERSEQDRRASERAAAALQLGVESALDVASELALADLVDRLVRRAAEVAHADRCVLLSVEDGVAIVEGSYAVDGADAAAVGETLRVSEHPLLLEAFERGSATQSTRINSEAFTPEQRARMAGLGNFATVPLLFGGEPIGALNLSRYRADAFSPEELMALTQIGQIAALAVRNARLFGELEAASRTKTDFLNLAAHELRTPISVIKGYLSLIAEGSLGPPPGPLLQPLAIIEEKTAELNRLVEDLLAAARVQAGSISAHVQDVDVAALLREAADRARPSINLARGRLRVDAPDHPVPAPLDPSHLERILDNLLNNAIAYSPGEPMIDLTLLEAGGSLRIEVRDHGRGIPQDAQDRVFDQFVRLEDPQHAYTPGTGLGLYISRGLAQRHGGDLVLVESEPGAGSTFAIILPTGSR